MEALKLGMIGLDTSHCGAFTTLLNNTEHPHHVPGGRVVAAFPGGNPNLPISRDRVAQFTEQMRDQHKVEILDSVEAVAERTDAIFLESVDGGQHLEQFAKLAPFGKPVFIDKPFTCSVKDAEAIIELSTRYNTPIFSCSSIRYATGIVELGAGKKVMGCETFGPAAILDGYPALFWYGIHSAEVLFAKMGADCREVVVRKTDLVDAVVGTWDDGRVGTVYAHRIPKVNAFGATVFAEDGVSQGVAQSTPPAYANLLQQVIPFFRTGKSPIDVRETFAITAFLEAANTSRETGKPVTLARLGAR